MDYSKELSPEIREKMKKNLVYVGIFAVVMFFAGLTSAYYVNMGGAFWLKYPMPTGFYWSTTFIALSSISYYLAIRNIKAGKVSALKGFMVSTFVFGILFVVFQFVGYRNLIERGIYNPSIYWTYPEILVNDGRYGDTITAKVQGAPIYVDGNRFRVENKPMSAKEFADFQSYMKNYAIPEQVIFSRKQSVLKAIPSSKYTLYINQEPLTIRNNTFYINDSTVMPHTDEIRLCKVAMNVCMGRGHFMLKGQYGKDFNVFLKGQKLDYHDGAFWFNGKILSESAQLKARETTDNASAFLYVITFAHLIHVLVALIYLMIMVINSLRGRYNQTEHLSLKLGALFWHFLGILWVYLFLFFIFIH
jgi:cytochrome c oxidase subunit III